MTSGLEVGGDEDNWGAIYKSNTGGLLKILIKKEEKIVFNNYNSKLRIVSLITIHQ